MKQKQRINIYITYVGVDVDKEESFNDMMERFIVGEGIKSLFFSCLRLVGGVAIL